MNRVPDTNSTPINYYQLAQALASCPSPTGGLSPQILACMQFITSLRPHSYTPIATPPRKAPTERQGDCFLKFLIPNVLQAPYPLRIPLKLEYGQKTLLTATFPEKILLPSSVKHKFKSLAPLSSFKITVSKEVVKERSFPLKLVQSYQEALESISLVINKTDNKSYSEKYSDTFFPVPHNNAPPFLAQNKGKEVAKAIPDLSKQPEIKDGKVIIPQPDKSSSFTELKPIKDKVDFQLLPIQFKEKIHSPNLVLFSETHPTQSLGHKISLHPPLTFVVPLPFEFLKTSTGRVHETTVIRKESKGERGENEEKQFMAFIPKGPLQTSLGVFEIESFAIGITQVTNSQFAHFLNTLFEEGKLLLKEGVILTQEGKCLCHTHEKSQTSQIVTVFIEGRLLFKPLKTTDHHPVTHVTYWGATYYCEYNGGRLPLEWEWERAAAMDLPHALDPLKKYIYGCGKDTLDLQDANYRDRFRDVDQTINGTTPVGFYNGESLFAKNYQTLKTHHAISPFGCYDMSGNVREWVAEGVVKGGSYNSPLDELRVEKREFLNPSTADAFTGFRMAVSIPDPLN